MLQEDVDHKKKEVSVAKKESLYTENCRGLWSIRRKGGGLIPEKLRGKYTLERIATEAIEHYVEG